MIFRLKTIAASAYQIFKDIRLYLYIGYVFSTDETQSDILYSLYKSVAHKFSSGLLVVVVKALLRHKRPKHPVLQISANAMTMIRTTLGK